VELVHAARAELHCSVMEGLGLIKLLSVLSSLLVGVDILFGSPGGGVPQT